MTRMFNPDRLGAILLPGLIALTPVIALAQAQQNPPPAPSTPQSPPAQGMQGGPMMGHGMMEHGTKMGDDKMKSGMGGPMGGMAPPQGQGGMASPQGQGSTAPADVRQR